MCHKMFQGTICHPSWQIYSLCWTTLSSKLYLRAAYLHPLNQKRPLQATQPAVGYITDERQAQATTILRNWAVAVSVAQRAAISKKAVLFLTGQESFDDSVIAIQTAHPKSRIPTFKTDTTGRDYLKYENLYQSNLTQVELVLQPWQHLDVEGGVQLRMENRENIGMVGQVDLLWADPYYGPRFQPTLTEQPLLRKIFDKVSHDYTVFIMSS